MAFIRNQKGSPTLRNFSSAVSYVLKEYVREYNRNNKNEKLPEPAVSVLGMPFKENIREALRGVKKINSVTLRFYPLNGDQEFGPLFDDMLTKLRSRAASSHGELVLRSPKSVPGVIDILEQSQGTVKPVIEVTKDNKTKQKIHQDEISQNQELEFEEDDIQSLEEAAKKSCALETMQYTSDANARIYEKNVGKIIPFVLRS